MEKHSNNNTVSVPVLQRDSLEKAIEGPNEPFALKIYKKAFPEEVIEHFYLYPRTQEGLVSEVNHQYIVKIPHAKRGMSGIQVEKKITDLIRHKTPLELPSITLKEGHFNSDFSSA